MTLHDWSKNLLDEVVIVFWVSKDKCIPSGLKGFEIEGHQIILILKLCCDVCSASDGMSK